MKGNDKVMGFLNEALKAELTAINQYFLHGKMCANWGYQRLADDNRKESIDEMKHAEALMDRILFLEGTPNMTDMFPIRVGTSVKAQIEADLALELEAVPRLKEAIKTCVDVGDHVSRDLFASILADEEHHVDFLEAQLHVIGEIGLQNYLAQFIHKA